MKNKYGKLDFYGIFKNLISSLPFEVTGLKTHEVNLVFQNKFFFEKLFQNEIIFS